MAQRFQSRSQHFIRRCTTFFLLQLTPPFERKSSNLKACSHLLVASISEWTIEPPTNARRDHCTQPRRPALPSLQRHERVFSIHVGLKYFILRAMATGVAANQGYTPSCKLSGIAKAI
eukprot:TRINITY_DN3897_c1_g1_i3.p1 TRINITY_DN3897_c1_g1~~TRINITY_DN3897_c1_g1_i3.p1  ORF type:complete len:118 (-),score=3.42 TRINITY_DN3897_c1_g1_i3:143-496(-)